MCVTDTLFCSRKVLQLEQICLHMLLQGFSLCFHGGATYHHPPLLIFSLGHSTIMYNLWCRSRFLERKMYVLKRFVIVRPDHV